MAERVNISPPLSQPPPFQESFPQRFFKAKKTFFKAKKKKQLGDLSLDIPHLIQFVLQQKNSCLFCRTSGKLSSEFHKGDI